MSEQQQLATTKTGQGGAGQDFTVYLVPFVLNEFFQSVHNVEHLVLIVMSNVSCVKPSFAVDCRGRGLGIVQITCRDV